MAEGNRHPCYQYFSNIWLGTMTTLKGMRVTIRHFFKPKVTMEYPEVRPAISEGHRGVHTYNEDACTICRQCAAVCPVDCILIEALGKGRESLKLKYDIDYSKCLFCNLCCEACAPKCLYMGENYDIAGATRDGCVLHFARTKSLDEVNGFKELLAKKEAEKKVKAGE